MLHILAGAGRVIRFGRYTHRRHLDPPASCCPQSQPGGCMWETDSGGAPSLPSEHAYSFFSWTVQVSGWSALPLRHRSYCSICGLHLSFTLVMAELRARQRAVVNERGTSVQSGARTAAHCLEAHSLKARLRSLHSPCHRPGLASTQSVYAVSSGKQCRSTSSSAACMEMERALNRLGSVYCAIFVCFPCMLLHDLVLLVNLTRLHGECMARTTFRDLVSLSPI